MSKKKLDINLTVEAAVLGIVSSLKDYKLAWKINQVFKYELKLEPTLVINLEQGGTVPLSHYCYQTETLRVDLIKNKGLDEEKVAYMVKQLPQMDYFFMMDGAEIFHNAQDEISKLKTIAEISFVQLINVNKLKSRDHFIFY